MLAHGNLVWYVVAATAWVGGCGGAAHAEPRYVSADPSAQAAFDRAREAYHDGRMGDAERGFESFVIAHPQDPLRAAAELHLGRIAGAAGDHDEATIWLEQAASSADASIASTARLELGGSLLEEGQNERALAVLEPLAGTLDGREAAALYEALARAAAAANDPPRTLRYLDAWCRYGGNAACATAGPRIDEAVGALDDATLSRLHDELPRTGRGWAAATARLGVLAAERGDAAAAARRLEELDAADAADVPLVGALRAAIEHLERVDWGAVGALLPLTGRARLVGEQIRAGLELAAAGGTDPIRLVVRDTAGGPDAVVRAIDEMVGTERVAAIVGPVDSADADVAARRAQELGVPLVTLTIRPDVTAERGWVLRAFQTNEADVSALVDHGRAGLGLRRFAVLYPDNAYGRVLRDLVEANVVERGGTVEASLSFPPDQTSFVEVCRELEQHDFEALVVPAPARTVALVAPALAAAGLWSARPATPVPEGARPVQLLLPSVAFGEQLVRQAGRYLQGAVFATVLWIEDPDPRVAAFVQAYRDARGAAPSAWVAQAYDALHVVRAARAAAPARTRAGLLESLLGLEDAPTVGSFRGFDARGEARAPLRLLRLDGPTFVRATP